jgi:hypothetical protein
MDPKSSAASNMDGIVVGYGISKVGALEHEKTQNKVKTPIHDPKSCFLKNPKHAYISSPRTFCAGWGNGTGVCNGDGGAGLDIIYKGAYNLLIQI